VTEPVLELDRLSVAYRQGERDLPVLHEVSLHINAGETYGLVGESGCGKSTLALAVVRYLGSSGRQTSGTVLVNGEDVGALGREALREWRGTRVAVVYQEPGRALNPTMRVGDQIAEVLRYHGLGRSNDGPGGRSDHPGRRSENVARSTADLLAQVSFTDPEAIAERYPHQLSGGQQQRIVLAMALAGRPQLLILDEPTTGLDVTVEAEVLDVVATLRDELDGAVLFISHNLALIGETCDRVGVLYAGKLVEEGTVERVLARPRHPYTSALLGCVPQIGTTKHDGTLRPIPGSLPALGTRDGGCPFAARCELVEPACREADPPLEAVEAGHLVACRRATGTSTTLPVAAAGPVPITLRGNGSPSGTPGGGEGTGGQRRELVSLDGVTVRYRETVAAEDVDLNIARGEAVGLVGESGSGKTTLGRALLGLVPLAEGHVYLDGNPLPPRVRSRDAATLQRLQMVFQSPDSTLNPRLPVRTTLQRAITKLGGTQDVAELAASVQLSPAQLEQRPDSLSGGLKQRAAIARAFAGNPDLVVCDEPVSSLDVSVQAGILDLLSRLQEQEQVAYLFISHDLAVTRYLSDRIAVMYRGQLVEVGDAGEVFSPPHHPYTDTLLRAAPALGKRRSVQKPPARRLELHTAQACRFADRCPMAVAGLCDREAPPWKDLADGHRVRCHFGADELAEQQTPLGSASFAN
jgi:peptide/nickel transport system ATP-binding protein